MVTALRLIGPLLVFVLLMGGFALSYSPKPANSFPSKLEKTCPFQGAWVPCFIRDEALSQQWDV